MSLKFDEDYYKLYESEYEQKYGHFERIAIYIRDVIKPETRVIDFGGALGYVSKWLNSYGIESITVDSSQYCYDNKVCTDFVKTLDEVNFDDYDVLVSWGVLSSVEPSLLMNTLARLNTFVGTQLHLFSCDDSKNSYLYVEYNLKSHDFFIQNLSTSNLVCWDHKKVIQGNYRNVPIWFKVSD